MAYVTFNFFVALNYIDKIHEVTANRLRRIFKIHVLSLQSNI